ncbi:MAG: FemAB family PEP-CTERM system-associated protein [Phycisphaerae bacterium]|nr:FemAB family PEP-CTERM system-associated protein [Phycisphaerae bacterium]
MTTTVETLSAATRHEWEAYVRSSRSGTFYHTLAWHDGVIEAFGHEPYYLMTRRQERLTGVLPLFLVRSWLAGRLLVSVPYAVYGGAIHDDDEAGEALLREAKALADRLDVRSIDFRSVKATLPGVPVVDRYVTFRKALPDRAEDVLGTLPRKARAAARNGRNKHALTTDFDDNLLSKVWRLYARSMRRLGSPNYPFRFFRSLVDHTPDAHVVSLVRYRGRPAAGLVTFIFGDTVLPYFSGCDETLDRYGVNNVLYLSLMEWAVEHGLRQFDFGRSRKENRGAYEFKRHQGFEPEPLGYQLYTPPGRQAPELTPGKGKFALAQRIYRRIPLCLTKRLGAWLAKAIPG